MSIENAKSSDADLVRQSLAGDADAYRLLARRHARAVYTLVRGIVRDVATAEAFTPRVFFTAYRHLDRFDAARSFRPWLFKLAANLSFHSLRRAHPGVSPPVAAPSPDRLPLLSRAILNLRCVQRLRYEEIAETLGIPPEVVLARLHEARFAVRPARASTSRTVTEGPIDDGACVELRPWLDADVDQELTRGDHRKVERHLASCGDCHDEWEAIQALRLAVSAEAEAAGPSDALLASLTEEIDTGFDYADARRRWRGVGAMAPRRPLPFGMESWPQLTLGLLTVAAVAFLVHVAQSRREAALRPAPGARGTTAPALAPIPSDPLLLWGGALVRLLASKEAPADRPPADPRGPTPVAEAEPRPDCASLLARENDPTLNDSLWMEGWRRQARRLADRSLAAADSAGGRAALAAYYRVVSRGGRLLLPEPGAQAQALAPDRHRIEGLLRLLGR